MFQKSKSLDLTVVEHAKKYQGFLKKRGGMAIKQWQKRYFSILTDDKGGYVLAYFVSQETSKPRGYLQIDQIEQILFDGDRLFTIKHPQKDMELKAKSPEIRDQWSKYLLVLKDHIKNKQNFTSKNSSPQKPQIISQNDQVLQNSNSFRSDSDYDSSSPNKSKIQIEDYHNSNNNKKLARTQSVGLVNLKSSNISSDGNKGKRKSLDRDLFNLICANQEKKNNDLSNSKLSNQDQRQRSNSQIQSELLLEQTGILKHLGQFSSESIKNRVIHGFLNKRSHKKIKKIFNKRWFFLISAKSLYPSYTDEIILQPQDLPPIIDLDTLYYYKVTKNGDLENEKNPKKGFNMIDCLEVYTKDMTISKDKGFTFSIMVLDRRVDFNAEKEIYRQKWREVLEISRLTTKELKKGNGAVKKNIDVIINIFDTETNMLDRRKKLRLKIDEDVKKLQNENSIEKNIQSAENLIQLLETLSSEMINIMQACMVKNPPRTDIIQEYCDYLHEILLSFLRDFWNKRYASQEIFHILLLAKWIFEYNQKMQPFCKDERLDHGFNILLEIYLQKQKQNIEKIIENIAEEEKNENVPIIENSTLNILQSETPRDVFKFIMESYELTVKHIKCPQVGVILAKLGQYLIEYYHQLQIDFIEESENIEPDQLICIANNSFIFKELIENYEKRLVLDCKINDLQITNYYNVTELKKMYFQAANEANDIFQMSILGDIQHHFYKKNFLELELDVILEQFVRQHRQSIKNLHDNFQRKIWKSLIECVTHIYFSTMIIQCGKNNKSDNAEKFIAKIREDQDYIQSTFSTFLFESVVTKALQPFGDMADFLSEDSGFQIQQYCKKLRESFGRVFTEKTVKNILNIRKDIDKESKKEIQQFCEDTIELYNKENQSEDELELSDIQSRFNKNNGFVSLGEEEDDTVTQQTLQSQENLTSSNMQRKITFNLDDDEDDEDDNDAKQNDSIQNSTIHTERSTLNDQSQVPNINSQTFGTEGYLSKKKVGDKIFEKRYFRIRDGYILWFKSEKSKDCINKIQIKHIEEANGQENKTTFTIKLLKSVKKGKEYKFKVDSVLERDAWLKNIKDEINNKLKEEQQNHEAFEVQLVGKQPIIVDHDKQNRIQMEKQKSMDKRKKYEERERERIRIMSKQVQSQADMRTFSIGNLPSNLANKRNSQAISRVNMTNFEIDNDKRSNQQVLVSGVYKDQPTCWDKFLQCLGLQKKPKTYFT